MNAIRMTSDAGKDIFVEVDEEVSVIDPDRDGQIAGATERQIRSFEEIAGEIAGVCHTMHTKLAASLGAAMPEELTLEFGVKLAGEGGWPLIAKVSAEAAFKVTAKWERSNGKAATQSEGK